MLPRRPIRKDTICLFPITSKPYYSYFKVSSKILTPVYFSLNCIEWVRERDWCMFPLWSSTSMRLFDVLSMKRRHPLGLQSVPNASNRPVRFCQKQIPSLRVKKLKNIGDAFADLRLIHFPVTNSTVWVSTSKARYWIQTKISDQVVQVFLIGIVWVYLLNCTSVIWINPFVLFWRAVFFWRQLMLIFSLSLSGEVGTGTQCGSVASLMFWRVHHIFASVVNWFPPNS